MGSKIVINTDSHHTTHMEKIRYGVLQARRAWLTSGDVLNTLPVDQFASAMKHGWPSVGLLFRLTSFFRGSHPTKTA